jgi:hypothetical protein
MLYCALAVADEIDERKRFLDEMRAMGQGAKYEHLIQGEIAEARTGTRWHSVPPRALYVAG